MDKKWLARKSSREIVETVASDDRYEYDFHDLDRVQRRLKQRHVQMIAIAGTIGTGLFLGSGNALQVAGPLGALIAYALVATVAYATLCGIAEMTTWAPISGTFPHYASRWVDPALGFAVGWNYFFANVTAVPVEINAAVILMTFWDKDTSHAAIYTAIIAISVCAINIFGVRYFGESEFFFSITKLLLIIILLISGLVLDLGGGPNHEVIGFKFWKHPGAVNRAHLVELADADRFLAILSVIIQAAFSFQGMELVCIAASETENPRRNITKAVRRVFYRVVLFYMLGILMIGMLVSYDNPALLSRVGTAAESPFVIAMSSAGVKAFSHIVNAVILTSAFSAASSYLFCSSRVLYGLAIRGQAPKIFAYTTKKGLPIAAVLTASAFALLSFMNVSAGAETVFAWFVNMVTTGELLGWFTINLTYVFFHRGMKAQGYQLTKNVYNNPLQPYLAYWGMGWTIFFILLSGYAVFFKFQTSSFLTAYINIPIFAALYFGYKFMYKTWVWKPLEMDFVTGIPTVEETELPEDPPITVLEKVANVLF
ncbi:general APC amino acid permease [Roridomyces roridus]|uniref:General APC amino acid permease n=1 Tax=Roridomyces roridus TaxID=1738132 RepID=A0AAD7FH04_9AGAR|nr:general APC amino acid permease [Roridomyces roridus]